MEAEAAVAAVEAVEAAAVEEEAGAGELAVEVAALGGGGVRLVGRVVRAGGVTQPLSKAVKACTLGGGRSAMPRAWSGSGSGLGSGSGSGYGLGSGAGFGSGSGLELGLG